MREETDIYKTQECSRVPLWFVLQDMVSYDVETVVPFLWTKNSVELGKRDQSLHPTSLSCLTDSNEDYYRRRVTSPRSLRVVNGQSDSSTGSYWVHPFMYLFMEVHLLGRRNWSPGFSGCFGLKRFPTLVVLEFMYLHGPFVILGYVKESMK